VEGTLTALGGIFNMGDIRSAWRHPLILMKSLSKRKRIEMATELAYTLQYTLRDAQASDAFLYDVAVSEAGNKKLYKRKWHEIQRGHKETAKAADMAMRSAAALQGRRYLMKQLRKGTLAKAVKALDTHDALSRQEGIDDGLSGQDLENFVQSKRPQTQQQWVSILRKSGVPSTSFRHNWRVMLEMQQAGLMNKEYMGEVNEEGDVVPGLLEEALNRTDGWNGVYSIGDLARLAVGQEGLSKSDRDKQIKMINALREYDRRFIKRYAIDPNPMDTSTDGAPWTQIINMYKSFPTAFTAQRMFRDASNMSMHGFALKHGSHVLLDVAYMMLIQMAAGKDWEEIEEEFEEDFIGTAMQYLARFPGLGPYGGWIAQVLVSALKAAMGDQTRWKNYVPISVAAGLKTMETFLGAINWKDNQEAAEGIVAMLRFIPFFGEAIFRAALQTTVNGLYGDPMGTGASNKFDQNVLQTQTGPRPATGQEPMVSDPEVIKRSRENHLLNKYNVTESDLKDLPMSNERGGN
jgi:hypothetical protein